MIATSAPTPASTLRVDLFVEPAGADSVRREVARELHDSVAQKLAMMLLDLETFKSQQSGRESVLRMVALLQRSTRDALTDMRKVLFDLRGTGTTMDWRAAVRALARSTELRAQIRVRTRISSQWPQRVPSEAGTQLFRIVEEALANAIRHSSATAVLIAVAPRGDRFEITVKDNGSGIASPDGQLRPGVVLRWMSERAALVGAALTVTSGRGEGTVVHVLAPAEIR